MEDRTGPHERPPPARKQNLPLVALFWAMQTSTIVPQFFPAECKYSISSPILPVNIASDRIWPFTAACKRLLLGDHAARDHAR